MANQSTETVRQDNTLAVIRSLRAQGPVARIDLGPMNGISSATVTSITSDLLSQRIIVEQAPETVRNGSRGRPRTLIHLKPDAAFVICAKVLINEIQLVVGDFSGQIRRSVVFSIGTLALTPGALCNFLRDKIEAMRNEVGEEYDRFAAVCLAIQGVVSPANGTIVWSPALSFRNAAIAKRLAEALGCPVLLENDANCIAKSLASQLEYATYPNLAVIMLGYGTGMSLLIDGKPYLGANGSAAEFGHSKYEPNGALCACGRRGCIEAYVSDYALYRDARAMLPLPPGDDSAHPSEAQMQALTRLATQGDPIAQAIFDKAGRALGHGLANVLALFNPDLVLITGSGVRGYEAMRPAVERTLEESLVEELIGTTRLTTCHWDRDMTCLGGIATALDATDLQTLLDSPKVLIG